MYTLNSEDIRDFILQLYSTLLIYEVYKNDKCPFKTSTAQKLNCLLSSFWQNFCQLLVRVLAMSEHAFKCSMSDMRLSYARLMALLPQLALKSKPPWTHNNCNQENKRCIRTFLKYMIVIVLIANSNNNKISDQDEIFLVTVK